MPNDRDFVDIRIRRTTLDLLYDQSEPGDTIDDRIINLIVSRARIEQARQSLGEMLIAHLEDPR